MTDVRNQTNPASSGATQKAPAASAIVSDAKEQVSAFASEALDRVKDIGGQASSSTGTLKDHASGLVESAKSMAAGSGDKILSAIEDQKAAGADRISGVAEAMRRAATELDKELPPAGNLVRQVADQVDAASEAVRRRDFKQLAGTVQDFARRQPAAFLGITVLAGFAAIRLLKVPVSSGVANTDRSGSDALHESVRS